jgi:2-polyprenyl-3-methyl-5-hydroxy-6-metoxy-1,4-benzoquinol methylase
MNICPVCADAGEKTFLCPVTLTSKFDYDLVECAACGLIYFAPLPSVEDLARFYSASYYDFERHKHEGKGMAFARKFLRDLPAGKFLDVGCATGFFLNGIRQNTDWAVYGVDFGSPAVRFAREELGLNVREGSLTSVGYEADYFDFVHVNNVLEHVLDPLDMLKECRRILKADGTFYLSVPNGFVDSRDLITFYKLEDRAARSKSGHIFFFPAATLRQMLAAAGFRIERAQTYGIRRGLKSLGLLPRNQKWKKPYVPRVPETLDRNGAVRLVSKKKKSDVYYLYRFAQLNAKMLPGLQKIGLDYQLILKPI